MRNFLKSLAFLSFLSLSQAVEIKTDVLQIRPSTLPSTGQTGQIRIDSSDGELKRYNSGWIAIEGGGGGASALTVTTQSSAYAIPGSNYFVLADATSAAFAISLPTASSFSGETIWVSKTDSTFNVVTLTGLTTLNTPNEAVRLISNGTAWMVVSRSYPTTWTAYTPVFTGFGTPTGVAFRWRRSGSDIIIEGRFVSGVSTAVEARISLPSGLTNSSGITTSRHAGSMTSSGGAATFFGLAVLAEPSVGYMVFGANTSSAGGSTKANGNGILSGSLTGLFLAHVPIQGWN